MRHVVVLLGLAGCDGVFNLDPVRDPPRDSSRDGSSLDTGLLLHMEFEGDFHEAVTSASASCVTTPCPTFEPGRGRTVAHFDGIDDCLTIAPASYQTIYTVAIWFNKPNDKVDTFIGAPYGGSLNTWRLETNTNRVVRLATVDAGSHVYLMSANDIYVPGDWTHVAASYDGSMRLLYVNGLLVATGGPVQPVFDPTVPIHIGCDRDNGAAVAHFGGFLDDVRVYSRALTDAEIAALAKP